MSGIWLKQISDHKLIFTQLNTFVPKQKIPKFILRKNITNGTIAAMQNDLTTAFKDFDPIFEMDKHNKYTVAYKSHNKALVWNLNPKS